MKNYRFQPIKIILAIGSVLCLALLSYRIFQASSHHYLFLIWNLFLAWIPLFLSGALVKLDRQNKSCWLMGIIFFLWLLFFPNSPYILTDLFHLSQKQNIPLWYDLVLIVSFAWNGLMLGFISLFEIQKLLNKKFSSTGSWIAVIITLVLSSFGIYLGRFERWNSWDILISPLLLIKNIIDKITDPFSHPGTVGVTLLFSLFLIISYLTLFVLIKSKPYEQ